MAVTLADWWDAGYHYFFTADDNVLYDQNAYYCDYDGHRFYNSAILVNDSSIMIFAISSVPTKVYRRRDGETGSASNTYTLDVKDANGNGYRPSSIAVYGGIYRLGSFTYYGSASNVNSNIPIFSDSTSYMNYIQTPVQSYTWQSVSSVAGKDGKTYRLTDILNINDGNAVNDVAYDGNLDFSADSKVNNLIADVVQDGSKVIVNYEIPEGTYQYVKLVYKLNEIPEDVDDGTAITISASSTSTEISGIATGDTYWFVIFTDISSSEPYEFNTSELNFTNFDYTGSIQTFTAPKSGYYSLETWGAQGGNISKNGKEARGGYGAYAYGEVYLNQGDTLYVNVGGQNGYNGGGNYDSGNIKNLIIPEFNQSIALDSSLWTENWNSGLLITGSLPNAFTLSYDFLDLLLNATLGTESVLIFERNGVKIYGMRDNQNATYGGYYKYSIYIKDGDEIVAGSQYPTAYYSQAWYVASGFDKRDSHYNSNVWSRIQALYLGFGVDDDAKLGYLIGCSKSHNGYSQGSYIDKDSYQSMKILNNTASVGTYCNSAKLYDALKKMAGEST